VSHQLAHRSDDIRRSGRLAAVCLSLLLLSASAFAADWHVKLDDTDVTNDALPFASGGQLFVDATRLAPLFHIAFRRTSAGITIVDREGTEWRAQPGENRLQSSLRSIDLGGPLRFDGRSLYLPITVLAELSGNRVSVDMNIKTILFRSAGPPRSENLTRSEPTPVVRETNNEGWQVFDIPKPRQELEAEQKQKQIERAAQGATPLLPPSHENLHVNYGVAAVQGGDYANEIAATGSIDGIQTQLYTLLTYGDAGAQYYSGHLGLFDPLKRRSFEAGDLYSEIWGLARGARVGWEGRVHRPQFSIYVPDSRTPVHTTLGSFTDEIFLSRVYSMAGEIDTDGSWLARSTLRHERFGLSLYSRNPSTRNHDRFSLVSRGFGGSAYVNTFRGISLQVNANRSGKGNDRLDLKNALLRVPMIGGSDITADRTLTESAFGKTTANGLGLGIPIRGLMMRTRYLQLVNQPAGSTSRFEQKFLTGSIGYGFGSRARFDLQTYHPLLPVGGRSSQQLFAFYQVSQHTSVEAIINSIGAANQPRQYRYRLQQDITPHYAVSVEYGQIPAYQPETILQRGFDRPRFKVMLHRLWDVPTPVGGAEVSGVVVDDLGRPVAGVPVRLGNYVSITDPSGVYAFEHVPPGKYVMSLDENGLPAAYAPRGGQRAIDLTRGEAIQIDWNLIKASGTVKGLVYIDRNANGKPDPGEGLAGAVVTIDGRATVSGMDGTFTFYNLPPGQYQIRLDSSRLPERVSPLSGTEVRVSFPHGETMNVVFRLMEKPKPIEFQVVH
jgi:hypothetical protein